MWKKTKICDQCKSGSKDWYQLKRHKQDDHDKTSASTFPKPKNKQKNTQMQILTLIIPKYF